MTDLNLDDLAVFVRVVERLGFASAARDLNVPTSTVSRAIERLESRAGVRLLHRTTRIVQPTTEGRDLFLSVSAAVTALRNASQLIEPTTRKPKGRLRVTAPSDLCGTFLADVIVAFSERYPQIGLDFALANRHANLVEEGFDLAIRATARLSDSSLVVRKLGEAELCLYASPEYLRRSGTPAALSDLEQHACILFRAKELARTWTLRSSAGDANVTVHGRIGGDDFTFVRAIVAAGGGIGILPNINCGGDEASGRLVRVLPEFHARGATFYLLYPSRKNVPARVTAFRDFVIDAFESWSTRGHSAGALTRS